MGEESNHAGSPVFPTLAADAPAYIFFTSGTSGRPKGILGNHRGLAHFIGWQGVEHGVTPADRVAQLTALSFDVILRDLFLPLCHGATLCLPPPGALGVPERILGWLAAERVSIVHLVPSIAEWWLDKGADRPETAPRPENLRWVFFAGEPLTASLVARWRERLGDRAAIVNLYGPTETTLAKFHFRVPPDPEEGVQPIGRPLPETRFLLRNAAGAPCAPGEPGEIIIRTPFRSSGYLEPGPRGGFFPNPADPSDLLYRAGDLGRRRADGAVEILGRLDDLIKIRGVRVSPAEVQACLAAAPGVARAVVLAEVPAPPESPRLIAFIQFSGPDLNFPALGEQLRRSLPSSMIPERFVAVTSFPLTANGKIDRRALLALARPGAAPVSHSLVPPADETEGRLLEIWQSVFGRPEISVTDHFLELGGHSLLAAQLAARLREIFRRAVPLHLVFEAPTIRELARRLPDFPAGGAATAPIMASPEPVAPLSRSQERIWLQHHLEPDLPVYHLPIALRLSGELDLARLQDALTSLVRRHGILRKVFRMETARPVQVVFPSGALLLEHLDLRGLPEPEREAQLRHHATTEALRPFSDLDKTPPVRAILVRLAEHDHILLLNLHHLVGDGWSSVLLLRELGELYSRPSAPVPALPFQYADFARWDRALPASLPADLAYWRDRLEGTADAPPFPTDFPPPAAPDHQGAEISLRLPVALSETVRSLARAEESSLFMVLLAAFQVYLAGLTDRSDLILGAPVANRPLRETESLIGCFINVLPLRGRPPATGSFLEFLRATRALALADFDHQAPFEEIVRIARPQRVPGVHPLFQVLLNVLNFDPLPQTWQGLEAGRVFPAVPFPKFAWTVYVREGPAVELQFIYSPELYDPARMRTRAEGFRSCLEQLLAHPHAPLASLRLDPTALLTGVEALPAAPPAVALEGKVPILDRILAAWTRHLPEGSSPGLDDNFFTLGGHSLLAMQVTYELEQDLGLAVPLRAFFTYPTVRALGAHLSTLAWHAGPAVPGQPEWDI